jgi:hypothetical protein
MSITSLSADPEKSRLVFRKSFHYTKIFEYFHFRGFFIRSFHLYGFCVWVFICMDFAYKFSSIWVFICIDFHLYEFSSVWVLRMGFHLYGFSSVWVLRMSFHLYGFCVWVFICMSFAYEFSSVWVLRMNFHLYEFCVWVFICGFSSVKVFFCGVCERSMRAKHFFDEKIIIRMFFCNEKLVYIII